MRPRFRRTILYSVFVPERIESRVKASISGVKFRRLVFCFACNGLIFAKKNQYLCTYSLFIIIERVRYLGGE